MRYRIASAAGSTWTVAAVNVLMFVVEIVALLIANPLPFLKPEALPYLMFTQAVLNILIKYISGWGDNGKCVCR